MSSLLSDIPEWVEGAPPREKNFRRAVHCVLEAIARDAHLRDLLCMKGGILMALHYDSPRFTTDIDFSTPRAFDVSIEEEVIARLSEAVAAVPEQLGYDIDCRVQGYKVQPSRTKSFVTINIRIGFAVKDTPQHRKLMDGMAPEVVNLDYSFRETIPKVEIVEVGDDAGSLRVYALSTLVAEKLRSLLQQPIRRRNRRQDVYDLNYLLDERPELQADECKAAVLEDLHIKCVDRDITATAESFDHPSIREFALADYGTLAAELPEGELPEFEPTFRRVAAYYRSLPWS